MRAFLPILFFLTLGCYFTATGRYINRVVVTSLIVENANGVIANPKLFLFTDSMVIPAETGYLNNNQVWLLDDITEGSSLIIKAGNSSLRIDSIFFRLSIVETATIKVVIRDTDCVVLQCNPGLDYFETINTGQQNCANASSAIILSLIPVEWLKSHHRPTGSYLEWVRKRLRKGKR